MVYHRGFCKILEHPIISLPVNQMCYQSDAGVPVHTIRLLLGVAGGCWQPMVSSVKERYLGRVTNSHN